MAKNQSLPAHLQEKDSRGEDSLTMYEHQEKPTAWWPRPSLSNPRSTNDIVWAILRTNPTLLQFVTNRVLTVVFKQQKLLLKQYYQTNPYNLLWKYYKNINNRNTSFKKDVKSPFEYRLFCWKLKTL